MLCLVLIFMLAGCGDSHISTTGNISAPSDAGYTEPRDTSEDTYTHPTSDADFQDTEAPEDTEIPDTEIPEDASPEEPDASPEEPDTTPEEPDASTPEPDTTPPTPDPLILWMAPNGSDTNDGTASNRPVLTLQRVQKILQARKPQTNVEVRIAPGRYRGQRVTWTHVIPGRKITFTRHASDTGRPIFDGCLSANNCPGGTWFILQHSGGAETNLVFNYLRVENYQTAISLNGSRNAEANSNGSNRIFGCYFDRIGNVFNSSLSPSTAAIRLVNSDDNEIINNHFTNIINTTSPALLHAIYIAHLSDRNQILRNRFENNAGDPIRVRDFSNNNVINDNTFKKVAIDAAYSEWYCEHDKRTDCTKATPECPSWGNQFRDNHLNGNYACKQLGTFKYYQGDTASGCAPPAGQTQRLRTSGNTHAANPCE